MEIEKFNSDKVRVFEGKGGLTFIELKTPLAAALFSTSPVRSLDEETFEDEGHTLADAVFDDEAEQRSFEHLAVRMAMEKLSEFERKIIILRYFRDFSQVETARVMGLTQVKVSRTEKKILAFLKRELL